MENIFGISRLDTKKFLVIVLSFQLMITGLLGLKFLGIKIPILLELVGIIYLTFIPASLILKILNVNQLKLTGLVIYASGLSIATLMFFGLMINTIFPYFNIQRPISIFPIFITLSILVMILWCVIYFRDKNNLFTNQLLIQNYFQKKYVYPALILILIPFLSILGTFFVNYYHNNLILLIMILFISFIFILAVFERFIPKEIYPLMIFAISLSLLYHNSLISPYINGWYIHTEYYVSKLVIDNGIWNSNISNIVSTLNISTVNAMLSVTMLAPIYSIITDINLNWTYKIIFPFLFSFVPLSLYYIVQKQFNSKIALMSCFFFISLFVFYTEMLGLARQQIGEIFFILIIALFIEEMPKIKKSILLMIFSFSIIVSHYGLSYIYLFLILVVFVTLLISKFDIKSHKFKLSFKDEVTITTILLFFVFALSWYLYVSNSSSFIVFMKIFFHIGSSINDLLNPDSVQGLDLLISNNVSTPLHQISKILYILFQFFIVIGILNLIQKFRNKKLYLKKEYSIMIFVSFFIIVLALIVPYVSSSLNTTRLFQISIILLAPLCIIGGIIVIDYIKRILRVKKVSSYKLLSILLVIYFLFNIGFIYQITNDSPISISLSQNNNLNINNKNASMMQGFYIDNGYLNVQDISTIQWLLFVKDNTSNFYSDYFYSLHGLRSIWNDT